MQIMPETAEFLARRSGATAFTTGRPLDAPVNIAYGSYYLRFLLDQYQGNKMLALAAYNGGETNVDRWVARCARGGRQPDNRTRSRSRRPARTSEVLQRAARVPARRTPPSSATAERRCGRPEAGPRCHTLIAVESPSPRAEYRVRDRLSRPSAAFAPRVRRVRGPPMPSPRHPPRRPSSSALAGCHRTYSQPQPGCRLHVGPASIPTSPRPAGGRASRRSPGKSL